MVRSRSGKKCQIFNFINVDKKGIFLDQFWLRNLMVSFVFCVRPPEVTKIAFEKDDVINGYDFGDKKHSIWGSKIELLT